MKFKSLSSPDGQGVWLHERSIRLVSFVHINYRILFILIQEQYMKRRISLALSGDKDGFVGYFEEKKSVAWLKFEFG